MNTPGANAPGGSTGPAVEIDIKETSGLAGKTIHGRYRLRSFLGSDFAGTLYLAEEQPGGRRVGLKILARGFFLKSEAVLEIDHPNVIRILKRLEPYEGLTPLLVEVPEGKRVRTILSKHRRLPPGLAVTAITQLLSALHDLHFKQIAAGNLDLDSLYLSRDALGDPAVRIFNLGIGDPRKLPDKPFYAAPEVVRGGGEPDRRADIWAAGVILFEMLFGRRPFGGKDLDEIAGNVLLNDPVFPAGFNDLPEELIAVVRKALQKDPERRYQNATTMTGDLLPVQERLDDAVDEEAMAALIDPAPGDRPIEKKSVAEKPAALRASVISRLAESKGKRTLGPVPPPNRAAAPPAPKIAPKAAPPPLPVAPPGPVVPPLPTPAPEVPVAEEAALPVTPAPAEESIDISFSDPPSVEADAVAVAAPSPELPGLSERRPRRRKAAVLIACGASVVLGLTALFFAFSGKPGGAPPPVAKEALAKPPVLPASPPAAKPPEPAPAPAPETVKPAAPKAPAEAAPKPAAPPLPDMVTITLTGLLPGAQVTVNRAKVGNPVPILRGREAVALAVHAEGYWTYSKMLVPDQDRTIEVVLEKKPSESTARPHRSGRNRQGAEKGPSERSYGKLASNPFGER